MSSAETKSITSEITPSQAQAPFNTFPDNNFAGDWETLEEPTLTSGEAAKIIGVDQYTLIAWDDRHNWPPHVRTPGGQRRYFRSHVAYLGYLRKDQDLQIASAVEAGRKYAYSQSIALQRALENGEETVAFDLISKRVALLGIQTAIMRGLVPTARILGKIYGYDSAPWASASILANQWMSHVLASHDPREHQESTLLIGDATKNERDQAKLETNVLRWALTRSGINVKVTAIDSPKHIDDSIRSHKPDKIAIAGNFESDSSVIKWIREFRKVTNQNIDYLFRRSSFPYRMPVPTILPDTAELAAAQITGQPVETFLEFKASP